MFSKDDYVVYPMHGVGIITEVAPKEILGKKENYYVIDLINTKMTVMVPVAKSEEIGLRKIIQTGDVKKILKLLSQESPVQEEDWKIRYQNNLTKVKSGSIKQIAEVCRDLYKRARNKELSIMERKLYESAYSLIINEVALSKELQLEDAGSLISEYLPK